MTDLFSWSESCRPQTGLEGVSGREADPLPGEGRWTTALTVREGAGSRVVCRAQGESSRVRDLRGRGLPGNSGALRKMWPLSSLRKDEWISFYLLFLTEYSMNI